MATMTIASITCCLLTLNFCSAGDIKSINNGHVVFDLLAGLRTRAGGLTRRGLGQRRAGGGGNSAVAFAGSDRRGKLELSVAKEIVQALANAKDAAFLFTLRQKRGNTGSLFAITNHRNRRLLELQSVWHREELKLHYVTEGATSQIHVEKLAYQLADGMWHQLAVTLSGNRVQLLIDCGRVYDRQLYRPVNRDSLRQRASVWIGQRGRWNSYFQGEMAEALLVLGKHGMTRQCPHMEDDCPSCQQHRLASLAIRQLQSEMREVQRQLSEARQQLQLLSLCDCNIRCLHNDTVREDGEVWSQGDCQQCKCNKGTVTCHQVKCPPVTCSAPVRLPGSCCPTCLRACTLHGTVGGDMLEHGSSAVQLAGVEWNTRMCVDCHCQDGTLVCNEPADSTVKCPKLNCPAWQQETNEFDCCPYCKDFDYCKVGHNCSSNADCVNRHNKFDCACRPGYHGNGWRCHDVDECEAGEHDCGSFADCVNVDGGFECRCRSGFSRVNRTHCADTDECSLSQHNCSSHARCINTVGGHLCECHLGYHGNGTDCLPVCTPVCTNGGFCVAPNICSCRPGYHGNRCQHDLDECSLDLHRCQPNSHCVNLPGTYHCVCNSGFHDSGEYNLFGSLCRDVNECASVHGHSCPRGSRCVNTLGGYACLCTGVDCNRDCHYRVSPSRNVIVRHGQSRRDLLDLCSECHCWYGVLNCTRVGCNCSLGGDSRCCPQCEGNATCFDAENNATRQSGEQWNSGCQSCKCMNGETQCRDIDCPPAACANPLTPDGACCPICQHADPCHSALWRLSTAPQAPCLVGSLKRPHGAAWQLTSEACVRCQCIDGHICCSHDQFCRKTDSVAMTTTPSAVSSLPTSGSVSMATERATVVSEAASLATETGAVASKGKSIATAAESIATAGASMAQMGASLATVGVTIATTAAALTTVEEAASPSEGPAAEDSKPQAQQQQQQQQQLQP